VCHLELIHYPRDAESSVPPENALEKQRRFFSRATEIISELLVKEGIVTADSSSMPGGFEAKLPGQRTLGQRNCKSFIILGLSRFGHFACPAFVGPVRLAADRIGLLREQDLRAALMMQVEKSREKLGQVLLESHVLQEEKLLEVLSIQLGFDRLHPLGFSSNSGVFQSHLSSGFARTTAYRWRGKNGKVLVAFADPLDCQQLKAPEGCSG